MFRATCICICCFLVLGVGGCQTPPVVQSLEYHGQSPEQIKAMYKKDIGEIREEVRNLTTEDIQTATVDAVSTKNDWKWISAASTAVAGLFSGGTYLVRGSFAIFGAFGTFKVSSYGDDVTDCPKLLPVITEINQFDEDWGDPSGRIFLLKAHSTEQDIKSTYNDYEAAKKKLSDDIANANLAGLCAEYKHPVSGN